MRALGKRERPGRPSRAVRRSLVLLLCAAAVASALLGPVAAPAAQRSCGWLARISGDQLNVAFPDAAAKYWIARIALPPGGHATLSGEFPHARYISFIDYTAATQAIDGIADYQIAPDAGSSNPFLTGADRTATRRSYSVDVVAGSPPAKRAANTLYAANVDGSKTSEPGSVLVIYRVYEPDRGRDIAGGVGLPAISVVSSGGQRTTLPDCPDDSLPDLGLRPQLAAAGMPGGSTLPNTGLGSRRSPPWVRYTNAANGLAGGVLNNDVTGDSAYPPASQVTNTLPSGGFYENVHNAYMTSNYSAGFGAVLAFRGRAALTPPTLGGEATMGAGQLRYWSFCTNNVLTMYYDCANDDAVAVDASDRYTIAISNAANRPANATTACGVTWLPAGPLPQATVILRNMLPAPGFAEAIQNARQGSERKTLGSYYPVGTYYSQRSDFERLGCHPPAHIGPLAAAAGSTGSTNTGGRRRARCSGRNAITVTLSRRRGRLPGSATIRIRGLRPLRINHPRRARVTIAVRGRAADVAVAERFDRRHALHFRHRYRARCVGRSRH